MKTEWDYSTLADAYLERPAYATGALKQLFAIANLKSGDMVCDIGAGVAHLTLPLAAEGFAVHAVEPNDAMRANGIKRTQGMKNVSWSEGTGEATGQPSNTYDFVSFGSSFNVCDRHKALIETARILKDKKHFACMWNHRNLDDPIQATIEKIIQSFIPTYGYGTRRESQTEIIMQSNFFEEVQQIEGEIEHTQSIKIAAEAWRSHATLHRQAGVVFPEIIKSIEEYLLSLGTDSITIPYTTRAWIARKKS